MLTEDIISHSEPQNQVKNQILEKKLYNLSDFEWTFSNPSYFETKFTQRVRFWFKSFTTRHILDWKKYNASDFELKILRRVRFWRKKI